ncbi:DUF58 domain-containing protein [Parvibium lacunae]|nr:DUF58 domain-containing protein [Parvibium lacunae]
MAGLISHSATLRQRLRQRLSSMVRGWQPEDGPLILRQNRIYVLPTRVGWLFLLTLIALLLAAINYNLALGYAMTFLLASIGLASLFHTFRNQVQLEFSALPLNAPAMAEQPLRLTLRCRNLQGIPRFAMQVRVHQPAALEAALSPVILSLQPHSDSLFSLAVPAGPRGYFQAPRLVIETRYPLGLWRAWSYWTPIVAGLIYPQPETPSPPWPNQEAILSSDTPAGGANQLGDSDLSHLRTYQSGDLPSRIDWKSSARLGLRGSDTPTWYVKVLSGQPQAERWFTWEQTQGLTLEARLARLTAWVLSSQAAQCACGLRLPGYELAPAGSAQHYQQCLSALACYGLPAKEYHHG